ncbi:hypothetical protein NC653_006525 [Populus alba x Populus x berolinensis]|uniref:Uncharacterized protein n=2 Tax=Populus alba x Populus x berolinensis TaxID=444605 RepID=A0AAD6WEG8_9ROSI|nr:hypothetical protein NC653_006525 [Populus alba x Populus x berolinensis]
MARQLVTVSNLPMLECDSEAVLLQDGYRQVSSYRDRDDISRDLHKSQHSNLRHGCKGDVPVDIGRWMSVEKRFRFSLIVNSKRRDSIKKTLTLPSAQLGPV